MRPKLRDIWGNLKGVASSPSKLVLLVGGAFAGELLVAMALSVSLRAFGDHSGCRPLFVVITLAGSSGASRPSPGGMGVVEASLTSAYRGWGRGGRRHRRGLHPAPVHLVPAAHLGLDYLVWMREEGVPMKSGRFKKETHAKTNRWPTSPGLATDHWLADAVGLPLPGPPMRSGLLMRSGRSRRRGGAGTSPLMKRVARGRDAGHETGPRSSDGWGSRR